MTIIAAFKTLFGHVLFGDMMLSIEGPNEQIHLPTIGPVRDGDCVSAYSPVGLRPKVMIITPRFAFAWAGMHDLAELAVEKLVELFRERSDAGSHDVRAVFADVLSGDGEHTTTFFGSLITGDRIQGIAEGPREAWDPQVRGIGSVTAAGFGVDLLREHFVGLRASVGATDAESASLATLSLIPSMIKRELLAPADAVNAGVGGAYEMVAAERGAFRYIDDYALLLWGAEIDLAADPNGRVELHRPYKLLRIGHAGATPVIRALALRSIEREPASPVEFFVVQPFRSLQQEPLALPPELGPHAMIPARRYWNVVSVREKGTTATRAFASCLFQHGTGDDQIVGEQDENGVRVNLGRDVLPLMVARVKSAWIEASCESRKPDRGPRQATS